MGSSFLCYREVPTTAPYHVQHFMKHQLPQERCLLETKLEDFSKFPSSLSHDPFSVPNHDSFQQHFPGASSFDSNTAPFTLIDIILIFAAVEAQNLVLSFNPSFINAVRSFQCCKPLAVVNPLGISVLSHERPSLGQKVPSQHLQCRRSSRASVYASWVF